MTREELLERIADSPVVAAVKDGGTLGEALGSECSVIFLLGSDLLTLEDCMARIKRAGKVAFVHVDLVGGLAAQDVAIDYIRRHTRADGVISTRPGLIRRASECGLLTVQRFFLLDSMALANIHKQMEQGSPDMIEVLPGTMPKIIRKIAACSHCPMIAGGLIEDKEDVVGALGAGAMAVSSTNPKVWYF